MIPVVGNKRVAYQQHVSLDVMIELWHMIINFFQMLLKIRLYHFQCVNVTMTNYQK